ncbi:hypothetical protein ABW21_db0202994 [Orbilia brochopaga]|nr:hypothetical protein ABW21_db0202994 [Drechslerella brochopaga]
MTHGFTKPPLSTIYSSFFPDSTSSSQLPGSISSNVSASSSACRSCCSQCGLHPSSENDSASSLLLTSCEGIRLYASQSTMSSSVYSDADEDIISRQLTDASAGCAGNRRSYANRSSSWMTPLLTPTSSHKAVTRAASQPRKCTRKVAGATSVTGSSPSDARRRRSAYVRVMSRTAAVKSSERDSRKPPRVSSRVVRPTGSAGVREVKRGARWKSTYAPGARRSVFAAARCRRICPRT